MERKINRREAQEWAKEELIENIYRNQWMFCETPSEDANEDDEDFDCFDVVGICDECGGEETSCGCEEEEDDELIELEEYLEKEDDELGEEEVLENTRKLAKYVEKKCYDYYGNSLHRLGYYKLQEMISHLMDNPTESIEGLSGSLSDLDEDID